MKLLNARFQNFRLLRDLEIDFSHETEREPHCNQGRKRKWKNHYLERFAVGTIRK